MTDRIAILLAAGGVLVYTVGYLAWYSTTPLGLAPVLDGREILTLATQIAAGELPREPFFRAMLYPATVAGALIAGLAEPELAVAARGLNGALHVLNAVLVGCLAKQLGAEHRMALIAGCIWGVYPVALHFAGDPLDITMAVSWSLMAWCAALAALNSTTRSNTYRVLASAAFALAVATRPQLITMLLAWWLWMFLHDWRNVISSKLFAATLPALLLLGFLGFVNLQHGGEFRVLPWQGSFNLWAANRIGAHGLYFEQLHPQLSYGNEGNPARLEALAMYQAARPDAALDISSRSAFWRERLVDEIKQSPRQWLSLLVSKARYLAGNFEQYNNKTYTYHKQRAPLLRWNPLCWSVLFALAAIGVMQSRHKPGTRLLLLGIAAYAAGLLLTYVSARFRLPLAPLLVALAACSIGQALRISSILAGVVALALSLIPMPDGFAERTFVQDDLLIARAANKIGAHSIALQHAQAALVRSPGHSVGLELECAARFNRWLYSGDFTVIPSELVSSCERSSAESQESQRLLAILRWRQGRRREALESWLALYRTGGPKADSALAALIMSQTISTAQIDDMAKNLADLSDEVLLALAANGNRAAAAILLRHMSDAELIRQLELSNRLFR